MDNKLPKALKFLKINIEKLENNNIKSLVKSKHNNEISTIGTTNEFSYIWLQAKSTLNKVSMDILGEKKHDNKQK